MFVHVGPPNSYPDPVTAGVWHSMGLGSSATGFGGGTGIVIEPLMRQGMSIYDNPYGQWPAWWRCDGCGHANDWKHLSCPHCGAQLPERYDP